MEELDTLLPKSTSCESWINTAANTSDIFTKNLSGPDFERQTAHYVGIDEYMKNKEKKSGNSVQGENVRNCD